MFDIEFEFSPTFISKTDKKIDEIIVSSCKVHYFSDNRLWSSFDELSYNDLNNNDYGFGVLDFEIGFTGYKGTAYPKVYTKCFRLLTDRKTLIKPMKFSNVSSLSKINLKGELVMGIRYYFRTEKEMKELLDCKQILIESFFALGKKTNTYAFACQMHKDNNDEWCCSYANTYRIKRKSNIKYLID